MPIVQGTCKLVGDWVIGPECGRGAKERGSTISSSRRKSSGRRSRISDRIVKLEVKEVKLTGRAEEGKSVEALQPFYIILCELGPTTQQRPESNERKPFVNINVNIWHKFCRFPQNDIFMPFDIWRNVYWKYYYVVFWFYNNYYLALSSLNV